MPFPCLLHRRAHPRAAHHGGRVTSRWRSTHPEHGYYTARAQRSGRARRLLHQRGRRPALRRPAGRSQTRARCWRAMGSLGGLRPRGGGAATAGSSRDILGRGGSARPHFYAAIRLHLVERSPAGARRARRGARRTRVGFGIRRRPACGVHGVTPRERTARRAAAAPGRDARQRPARGVRGRPGTAPDARGAALLDEARRVPRARRRAPRGRVRTEVNLAAADWMTAAASALKRASWCSSTTATRQGSSTRRARAAAR